MNPVPEEVSLLNPVPEVEAVAVEEVIAAAPEMEGYYTFVWAPRPRHAPRPERPARTEN